jgi:hypothetical protein
MNIKQAEKYLRIGFGAREKPVMMHNLQMPGCAAHDRYSVTHRRGPT